MEQTSMCSALNVLVVDPTSAADKLARGFAEAGCRVSTARNCREARAHLERSPYGLVTMEWCFEDGSGLALLTHIVRHYPGTPVAVATAYGTIPSAQQAIRAGALDYMTKPVSACELLDASTAGELRTERRRLSLEDARREYILDILALYGSLAAAARALWVDRRSLRRMLKRFRARESHPIGAFEAPSTTDYC